MSKARDIGVEVPTTIRDASGQTPPLGDKVSSKPNAPWGSNVDELSTEHKKLKFQRKIDKFKKKLKSKKSREVTSSSSSNEESDASSEKEIKNKKGKNRDKKSYNTTSFNYDNLTSCGAFTFVPIGKAPHFNGMDYNKWRYTMKMHLISLNPSVWKVVCIGVDFPNEDEKLGFEQLQ
jgi:hypothetical protein